MPTDYDKLREENIGRYGSETVHLAILGELYAERTHFIFELLQNSEDAKAKHVRFDLNAERLDLLHDGRKFNDGDVRAVCSVCQSTSEGDSERIGRFGIGFKSVYCYTATPEIHSGDEHFAIEHYVRPKAVAHREIVKGQSTLITLPFNSTSVVPTTAFGEIDSALQNLDERALLFLRRVESLEVSIEDEDGIVHTREIISSPDKWIRIVSLNTNAGSGNAQRWLVAEKTCKLKGTAGKPVCSRVEIAFALASTESDSEIEVECHDGATLAVFFPTDKPTNTGFILQGPYRTTPARDNILVNDPINERLVVETCELLVETLLWFREQNYLTVEVLNTLPLSRADFPNGSLLCPLFERVLTALKEEPLLPAHSDNSDTLKFICGNQAVAASDPELRELLTNDELKEALGGVTDWRWLSEDISLDDESDLAVYLRDEIVIQEFNAEHFISWLETKDADWWKELDKECLVSAYRYLHSQAAEHKRLRKMPLVRLESGEHVSPDEQAVFFPADNIHEKKELAPFLSQLPIIRLSLLDDDEDKTIESFLRRIGVSRLVASEFIKHYFIPRFQDASKHSVTDVLALGRYLFCAYQRMNPEERQATVSQVSELGWLLCKTKSNPDANYLNAPNKIYVGSRYTKSSALEDYFSASPNTYFVHESYLEDEEDWLTFLETLGCSPAPRKIEDGHEIDGLAPILARLSQVQGGECLNLSSTIFEVLSATVPHDDYDKRGWGTVTNRVWITRRGPGGGDLRDRSEPAHFIARIKKTAWLPQISGELCPPGKLFENTDQNRKVLGDRVFYLNGIIKFTTEKHRWLAKELGIQARPTKEAILNVLRVLKAAQPNRDEVAPLYAALAQFGADVTDEFEKGELIFCPDSDKKWRPQSEVFWNDESPVFGSTRGYLKQTYPELQSFFLNIEAPSHANAVDYVKALLEVAKIKVADKASQDRICRIYKRLSPLFDEGGDWQEDKIWENHWEELKTGSFWLGRTGEQVGFYSLSELVVVDNEHLENLFHRSVAFWPFKDLNDFAKQHLKIDVCSAAEQDFQVENKGSQQDALSERLTKAWACIGDFLQSDKWRDDAVEGRNFSDNPPLIRTAGQIAVIYTLKGVEAEEPDGKAAFFDPTENTVWLVSGDTNESDEHFEALSEALQEYFGPEALREFVFDLLRKGIEKSEAKWRKRGLMSRHDVPSEIHLTELAPSISAENLKIAGGPAAPAAVGKNEDADQSGDASKFSGASAVPDAHVNPPPADTKGVQPAPFSDNLKDALNKPGKAPESPQEQERSPVSNSERRREKAEMEIANDREKEPRHNSRQKVLPRTVWESKNPENRIKLKEWYSGHCQICSETFSKRSDGENYFEACYLAPRTTSGAGWLDRVGNVLCLCADCSAKFQYGSIESPADIQKKIADLKLVKEGGTQPHTISIRLCAKDVAITFDERHLIELQSMLKVEHVNESSHRHHDPRHQTKPPHNGLVQCPHCQSKVRSDRLDKHVRYVHGQCANTLMQSVSPLAEEKSRRCKTGCGRPALPACEYCNRCM